MLCLKCAETVEDRSRVIWIPAPVLYSSTPCNKTDELRPAPHHCNISASYFTFSLRNCQLFVVTVTEALLASGFCLEQNCGRYMREKETETERLRFCQVSFVTTKPLCRNPHFNLFIYMREKRKKGKNMTVIFHLALLKQRWKKTLFNNIHYHLNVFLKRNTSYKLGDSRARTWIPFFYESSFRYVFYLLHSDPVIRQLEPFARI